MVLRVPGTVDDDEYFPHVFEQPARKERSAPAGIESALPAQFAGVDSTKAHFPPIGGHVVPSWRSNAAEPARLLFGGYTVGILSLVTPNEVRELRKLIGLTQLQLSQAIGVRANTVARWERGELRIGEPAARLLTVLASNPEARRLFVGELVAATE